MDWGIGSYERTAAQLLPAAQVTVEHLAPRPGERIADVGCGTGNATLLVADVGADVIGVDPAQRLLAAAREAADRAGLAIAFVEGDAGQIPVDDSSLDAVVSVFGIIFAPDSAAAAAELDRVLRRTGRVVLSAWRPGGAVASIMSRGREALADLGHPSPPPPFPWHEPAAVQGLLEPLGFQVSVHHHQLAFTAPTPETYADEQLEHHPMWNAARAVLEPAGRWQELRAEVIGVLTGANEDPTAFRTTSDYVVVVATR